MHYESIHKYLDPSLTSNSTASSALIAIQHNFRTMTPHLLSLPAELRNLIYEYALTEQNGIFYEEDEIGVGRLFVARPRPIKWYIQPSNFSIDLYECLHGPWSKPQAQRLKAQQFIHNQLQFVCRKLHRETSGLTIRYNTIIFNNTHKFRAIKQCARFLRLIKPVQREYVQARILYGSLSGSPKIIPLLSLFQFCKTHPGSRISMHFQCINQTPAQYFRAAHFLHAVFGKQFPLPFHKGGDPAECNNCRIAHLGWPTMAQCETIVAPTNFRIFPAMERFNEACFKNCYQWVVGDAIQTMNLLSIDGFVAWAKDWCENGA